MKTQLAINNKSIDIYCSASVVERVIYINGGNDVQKIMNRLAGEQAAFIVINNLDWNRELSPWAAPRVFRDGADFSGGGAEYLDELIHDILPAAEAKLGIAPMSRAIAGYSLAGLFAVWVLYRTDLFDCAASMSGSLWYDGFREFICANKPCRVPEKMYFSLGCREKMTKNPRMATIEDCTNIAAAAFCTYGSEVKFEKNPGGHFNDVPERMARGIRFLIS